MIPVSVDNVPTFEYFPVEQLGGSSESADSIQKIVAGIKDHYFEPVSFAYSNELLKTLVLVYKSCSTNNWDGYGALEIKSKSFVYAKKFICNLPAYLPKPDIGADPDGEISFEWRNENNGIYVLSISATGELSFAGLYSEGREIHGKDKMSDGVPKEIFQHISRLFAHK